MRFPSACPTSSVIKASRKIPYLHPMLNDVQLSQDPPPPGVDEIHEQPSQTRCKLTCKNLIRYDLLSSSQVKTPLDASKC